MTDNNVTLFCEVYCKFLSKITDEMFIELTYQDTLKLLKSMLLTSIVNFKFPKKNIRNYYLVDSDVINCDNETFAFVEERTKQEMFTDYCNCSEVLEVEETLENLDH